MAMSDLVASIARQEAVLTFERFDEAMAWRVGCTLHERAMAKGWPIVIDVRLFHRPLFFAALPGSTPDNVE